MLHLNPDFYNDLAQELITAICDKSQSDGVIELKIKTQHNSIAEVLFAFNAVDYTLSGGLNSMNYLMLAFDGGVRCSTDFNAQTLSLLIE